MSPGALVFLALAFALYALTIFSAGYRRRWWMAAIVILVLGLPMGLAFGGEGVTGAVGVAGMLALAGVAWVIGRRYSASRSARPPPPRRDLF